MEIIASKEDKINVFHRNFIVFNVLFDHAHATTRVFDEGGGSILVLQLQCFVVYRCFRGLFAQNRSSLPQLFYSLGGEQ